MRVLIVGTLKGHVSTASKIAIRRGAKVSQVDDHETALAQLRSGRSADLILFDLNLDIKTFLESLQNERISVPVVACGIDVDPDRAANAIRYGAKEYIPMPPDPELIAAVLQAVSHQNSMLVSREPVMEECLKLIDKIAPTQANVFITGESGTGKEVMAQYIHQKSNRSSQSFISVNCAAIPENLLESELFGHEKGAFTGAVARRIGKFEEASGGTLLLDEISEMPFHLQAKLLRAIQEKVIDRVGGSQPVKVDIRIIATSNRNLVEAVRKNEFREDLYFRLNVVNVHLPPLRERPGDIEALARYFIAKYAKLNQISLKDFSQEALQAMKKYAWPGNVRELENAIHRALILCQNENIEAGDVIPINRPTIAISNSQNTEYNQNSTQFDDYFIGRTVAQVEQDLILGTLDHCLGNRTHAAHILGISIRTLRNKLKEYAQDPDDPMVKENITVIK